MSQESERESWQCAHHTSEEHIRALFTTLVAARWRVAPKKSSQLRRLSVSHKSHKRNVTTVIIISRHTSLARDLRYAIKRTHNRTLYGVAPDVASLIARCYPVIIRPSSGADKPTHTFPTGAQPRVLCGALKKAF